MFILGSSSCFYSLKLSAVISLVRLGWAKMTYEVIGETVQWAVFCYALIWTWALAQVVI